jgi:KAP-like P-loop domain-containing protein
VQRKNTRERIYYILQRWANIGTYALIGSAFIAYGGRFVGEWTETHLRLITGQNSMALLCLSLALGAIVLWQCNRLAGARWEHLRWIPFYPPLPIAVILAFILEPVWPVLGDKQNHVIPIASQYAGMLALSYVVFWLFQISLGYLGRALHANILATKVVSRWEGKTLDELTDDELREWLDTELPIDDERRDLFRAAEISERLLQRLDDGKNSIALQGAYGAGKSSIIQMAEKRAKIKKIPLWFVKISCWGFDDSALIQRGVLDQVVQCVGDKVDCFAIRGVPQNYVDATKDIGWLSIFRIFVSRRLTPLEELQRLTPVLTAIGHNIVVAIEDVDRNGRSFDLSDIQALLARFREVNGVSFILSISNEQ